MVGLPDVGKLLIPRQVVFDRLLAGDSQGNILFWPQSTRGNSFDIHCVLKILLLNFCFRLMHAFRAVVGVLQQYVGKAEQGSASFWVRCKCELGRSKSSGQD